MAERIPDAQLHVIADAGHMINMEQPGAVNDLLLAFLEHHADGQAGFPAAAGA